MIISLKISQPEHDGLRHLAAREFGDASPATLALLIRRMVLNLLDTEAILDRNDMIQYTTATEAPQIDVEAPDSPPTPKKVAKAPKPVKARQNALTPPSAERAGKPTVVFQIWRYMVEQCLESSTPSWFSFELALIQQDIRAKDKTVWSAVQSLIKQGWIHFAHVDKKSIAFNESAKTWLLKNQQLLHRDYGMFADELDSTVSTK